MEASFLKSIFQQFDIVSEFKSFRELNSGHINDTFLIFTKEQPRYILQRINHQVFKNIPALQDNKVKVSQHIRKRYEQSKKAYEAIQYIATPTQHFFYQDEMGDYWNLMIFIENSKSVEYATSAQQVYEAGKLFGNFLQATDDFPATELHETLADFHNLFFRYTQFEEALANTKAHLKIAAAPSIALIIEQKEAMQQLNRLQQAGKIPLRVTHNDTKISNILFDPQDRGKAVIDLDTVMPGIVHFDFGDAVRSICSTASEEEQDLTKIDFKLDYYRALCSGFSQSVGDILHPIEIQYLPLAGPMMIYTMALRFLTDYLNGNIYYKIAYPAHNLIRARNQLFLLKKLQAKTAIIEEITFAAFSNR